MCVHVCLCLVCLSFFFFLSRLLSFRSLSCLIVSFHVLLELHAHSPPSYSDREQHFLSALSSPVQSSRLALESVMLVVFGGQQPRLSLWAITAH